MSSRPRIHMIHHIVWFSLEPRSDVHSSPQIFSAARNCRIFFGVMSRTSSGQVLAYTIHLGKHLHYHGKHLHCLPKWKLCKHLHNPDELRDTQHNTQEYSTVLSSCKYLKEQALVQAWSAAYYASMSSPQHLLIPRVDGRARGRWKSRKRRTRDLLRTADC